MVTIGIWIALTSLCLILVIVCLLKVSGIQRTEHSHTIAVVKKTPMGGRYSMIQQEDAIKAILQHFNLEIFIRDTIECIEIRPKKED